jgi:cysteine-rich repeat protein
MEKKAGLILGGILLFSLVLVGIVMAVETPITATVTINEFIDVTLTDRGPAGFDFGNIDPNTINNKEAAQTDGAASVLPAVEVTNEATSNVDAEISLKGTDFTGAGTIAVTNVAYDDDGAVDEGTDSGTLPQNDLTSTYPGSAYATLSPGSSVDIWFWFDAPGSQTAGSYSSTFTFQGGGVSPVAVCGNNIVEIGEECDDGNTVSGDGCSSSCQNEIEVGIPMSTDITTWQSSDSETLSGGGRWYCNAALAVNSPGTLTNWEVYVDNGGINGELAQLAVIRCTAGGGGAGPALSGCTRVGLGPSQAITGDGLNAFTLAGSTQLDGASPDANGIVVQTGDYICADSDLYDIGVDCDGSSSAGGCPGPDFNTQSLTDLDTATESFTLLNSGSDGTLMIKAWG